MLKVTNVPIGQFTIAVSGGIDSISLANYLFNGKRQFNVIHFNHNTQHSQHAEDFVYEWCKERNLSLSIRYYVGHPSENAWARWRNEIMQSHENPVLTAHHMDDSVESYLMRGKPIAPRNRNIVRPFIFTTREDIVNYAINNIEWVDDPSNMDTSYRRNKIRHELLPLMRKCGINPYNLIKEKQT